MTIEEFNHFLSDFGKNIQVGESNNWWEQAVEKVVEDLRQMGITSKRGNIDGGWEGEDVYIEMAEYLLFQNYGVKAWAESRTAYNTQQDPVETGWGTKPSGGTQYEFGVGKQETNGWGATYSGLNAKRDFSLDGRDYNIQQELQNYFEAIQQAQSL